jgi:hypothetical protein
VQPLLPILTGHAPVRGHLHTMGLFDGNPTCRFCRKETETVQHICCCEALARQRHNVFGSPFVEKKGYKHSFSIRTLRLHKGHRVIESVLIGIFRVAQYA